MSANRIFVFHNAFPNRIKKKIQKYIRFLWARTRSEYHWRRNMAVRFCVDAFYLTSMHAELMLIIFTMNKKHGKYRAKSTIVKLFEHFDEFCLARWKNWKLCSPIPFIFIYVLLWRTPQVNREEVNSLAAAFNENWRIDGTNFKLLFAILIQRNCNAIRMTRNSAMSFLKYWTFEYSIRTR